MKGVTGKISVKQHSVTNVSFPAQKKKKKPKRFQVAFTIR